MENTSGCSAMVWLIPCELQVPPMPHNALGSFENGSDACHRNVAEPGPAFRFPLISRGRNSQICSVFSKRALSADAMTPAVGGLSTNLVMSDHVLARALGSVESRFDFQSARH
jgi:hypothetical protein